MRDDVADQFLWLNREARDFIEERVAAFEASWNRGERPEITDFLESAEPFTAQLLVELIHADLEFRIRAGETTSATDYLRRFRELEHRGDDVQALIDAESELRRVYQREAYTYSRSASADVSSIIARLTLNGEESDTVDHPQGKSYKSHSPPKDGHQSLPVLPGYRVVEELGRGGMGIVYKAIESKLKRMVAIKTVRFGADASERERLHREAETAASLQHPNVVEVYRVFEHDNQLYVVSEYIPGGTLAALSAGKPLSPRTAATLLLPIAQAVGIAHSRGFVHRDLKPSNVLIAANGIPKVADFGLAKKLDDESHLTRTGVITGSPSYMAPEQALAEREVGPAADVWAFGVILYELLTGRPPFQGATSFETLELVRWDEPVSPRKLVPRLPRDLETICLKCLEKQPARRYASARLLADDLGRFLKGEPVLARPLSGIERGIRWAKRHPTAATLVATVLITLLAGSIGLAQHLSRLDALNYTLQETVDDRDAALSAKTAALNAAEAERQKAVASDRYSQRLLFASDMRQAVEAVRTGDYARANELLTLHRDRAVGEYAFVWNHVNRLVHAPGIQIDHLAGPAYFLCFSPNKELLAACGAAGEIRFYEAGSWKPTGQIVANQGELNGLAFSSDGTRLASAGDDGSVVLWDLATRTELWRRKIFDNQAFQVVFGLEGRCLAVCGVDPHLVLLDPATGDETDRFRADDKWVEAIAVTPTGNLIITAGHAGRSLALDLQSRQIEWQYEPPLGPNSVRSLMSISISADGRRVAFGTRSSTIHWADVATGRFQSTSIPNSQIDINAPANRTVAFLSGKQPFLAIAGDAGTVHLARLTAKELQPLDSAARPGWFVTDDRIQYLAPYKEFLLTASRSGNITVWKHSQETAWERFPITPECDSIVYLGCGGTLDSPRFIAASDDYGSSPSLDLIDSRTLSRVSVPQQEAVGWRHLIASKNGRRLFGSTRLGVLGGWDLTTSSPVQLFRQQFPTSTDIDLGGTSVDGRIVILDYEISNDDGGSERELVVADGLTGEIRASRRFERFTQRTVAENGSVIAAYQQKRILLLNPETLETIRELRGHRESVGRLALSRDGRRLASVCDDREIIIWETKSGRILRRWQSDAERILSIMFSSDSKLLLTAMKSRPPQLWDLETGRMLINFKSLNVITKMTSWAPASFTPEGDKIIVGSGKSVIVLQAGHTSSTLGAEDTLSRTRP